MVLQVLVCPLLDVDDYPRMTDYAEEQRNEIEALMSIYPEELQSKTAAFPAV